MVVNGNAQGYIFIVYELFLYVYIYIYHIILHICRSQFRKSQFIQDKKNTQKNASKIAIFIEKENPGTFF